jgi:hypothetical protein
VLLSDPSHPLRRFAVTISACFLFVGILHAPAGAEVTAPASPVKSEPVILPKTAVPKSQPASPVSPAAAVPADPDDESALEESDAQVAAVAKPVTADLVQVYGWRENVQIKGIGEKLRAKLDTGALTSSIHAEEKVLFERDGKKWVRFVVLDPSLKKSPRTRIEAPLVRMAMIKEPGGVSEAREVVRLGFMIGDRKMSGEFTLNNRSNMLAPVLIGRSMIKDLGWVDSGRTYLADQKIFR